MCGFAHRFRAISSVQTHGRAGGVSPAAEQQAARTLRSKVALCAAIRVHPSRSGRSFAHTAANDSASFRSAQVSPWTWVQTISRRGGRISTASDRTTCDPSTRTRPTAQALSRPWSAVSKSMEAKGAIG